VTAGEQDGVMAVIYGIKAGDRAVGRSLVRIARELLIRGAEGFILGCTELSLVDDMYDLGCPLFDPLEIAARRAVEVALHWDGPRGRASLVR
jgi:aspartate/glutamate racemase